MIFLATDSEVLNSVFSPYFSPAQYKYQQYYHSLCFYGYQYFKVILDFLSNIFHQFLILIILNHLLWFLLSDLFHHIIYHQSYLSDFFHQILSQYCLFFSVDQILPVSRLLYNKPLLVHHFYLYDIFNRKTYNQSHPSDFFLHIISQYCHHFSLNSIFPV